MKMLVDANATNEEAVQAVSHDVISLLIFAYMLYICLTLCLQWLLYVHNFGNFSINKCANVDANQTSTVRCRQDCEQ